MARKRPRLIRPAVPADVPALVALEERAFTTHRIAEATFRRMLLHATRPVLVFAAEDDGRLLGYASVLARRGFPEARLFSIAVADAARGRGAGRSLLAAAEHAARDLGCTSLRLEVDPENSAAVRLYEAAGYAVGGRHPDWYGPGRPCVVYRRSLIRVDRCS